MSKPLAQSVAEEIRAELGRQRKTGTDLARGMNVSQAWVSRRLTGELPFDLVELEQVAGILQVPVGHLLAGSGAVAA